MEKPSPDAILLKHGKWSTRQEWIELVKKERKVEDRQAWNIIKKESKTAIKHVFPDRSTIYGMSEFGPPVSTEVTENVISPKHGFWSSFFQAGKDRKEREARERRVLSWSAMEAIAEAYPEEMGFWKDIARIEKKNFEQVESHRDRKNLD